MGDESRVLKHIGSATYGRAMLQKVCLLLKSYDATRLHVEHQSAEVAKERFRSEVVPRFAPRRHLRLKGFN